MKVSVIIRSKNEEKWIEQCLFSIKNQNYSDHEIIIVDNDSTDNTLKIASKYNCKIFKIRGTQFNYSRALNLGIEKSRGKLIAIISAHCIPINERWLSYMTHHFIDEKVSAVYGKQEPLPDSSPIDKRDLWFTFGQDRKSQIKDCFFHNANSMIRKDLWLQKKFNENINSLEDQEWAKYMLKKNKKIIYEPNAVVFHFHGIHQNNNQERLIRNVKVIEFIQSDQK